MRTIKALHKAEYEPIADLVTYRAMPTRDAPMNLLDPFIFLNHHGKQEYGPNNSSLPFGPHPHRGFETVTFILEGDLMHKDSSGAESIIKEGGVQWMTAGKGLIHAEVSSEGFKKDGGLLEILQLWINLPAKHKMTAPHYTGLQKEEIPASVLDNGKVTIHAVAGKWNNVTGPVQSPSEISLSYIDFKQSGRLELQIAKEKNIFLYIVRGEIDIDGKAAGIHNLVEMNHDDEQLILTAKRDAIILLGYAKPFNEPFVAYGPFVMNTKEEIMQAYDDYNKGLFGNAFTL